MSDVRIGLVAEGKTDLVVIEAALQSILGDRSFVLKLLQPETSAPFGGADSSSRNFATGSRRVCRLSASTGGLYMGWGMLL